MLLLITLEFMCPVTSSLATLDGLKSRTWLEEPPLNSFPSNPAKVSPLTSNCHHRSHNFSFTFRPTA